MSRFAVMDPSTGDWVEVTEEGIRLGLSLVPAPHDDLQRIKRQAYLAYLYLNVVDCVQCHLPKAQGLVCPCGYDGAK